MTKLRSTGWNGIHNYVFKLTLPDTCEKAGMYFLASLPGVEGATAEQRVKKTIDKFAVSDNILWWDLPEERRHWIENEMAIVRNYSEWTRKYDPQKRPNHMYIPGHYTAEDVKAYVPYLDIIPCAVYTTYTLMPHAWVRWRVETTMKGIELAGAGIGKDYLNGQKTVVAMLELFYQSWDADNPAKVMTPEGAYHDFWQSIVSGVRGIGIYSYGHRNDKPEFVGVLDAYHKAASQISGQENLGKVILYGSDNHVVKFKITAGPDRTPEFIPHGTKLPPVSYPSIDLLSKVWNGNTYVFAVNSAEEPVTATITGLPPDASDAEVLFEDKVLPVSRGEVECKFPPLGVHILKIRGRVE